MAAAGKLLASLFPEAVPPEGVVPKLLAYLDATEVALDQASFPEPSRTVLKGQLATLKWLVANWHRIGHEAVSEARVGFILSFQRARASASQSEPAFGAQSEPAQAAMMQLIDWIG